MLSIITMSLQCRANTQLGAAWFDKVGADGATFQYLPNGDYRLLMSVLKPGSNYSDWSQWETYLSPVIRLTGDNF
jgi:hypothetical protein